MFDFGAGVLDFVQTVAAREFRKALISRWDWQCVFLKTAISVLRIRAEEKRVLKRILEMLSVVCVATSMASSAENPFIGQWKFDSSRSRTPDEMKVESQGGNKYTFDFGGGAETILADGTDQPGLRGTLLSAKQEAPDTWTVQRKKDGRLLLRATWKLSADGSRIVGRSEDVDDYFSLRQPGQAQCYGLRAAVAVGPCLGDLRSSFFLHLTPTIANAWLSDAGIIYRGTSPYLPMLMTIRLSSDAPVMLPPASPRIGVRPVVGK